MTTLLEGEFHHSGELEQAVVDRLTERLPAYVAAVERAVGDIPGSLPTLRGIVTVSELVKWPENQLPCAVIASGGTTEKPNKDGNGYYHATYEVMVMVVTAAKDELSTRLAGQKYGAAVRGALLQERSLNNTVATSDWLGEELDNLGAEDRRTIFACSNTFEMKMENIVSWAKGPLPVDWENDPGTVWVATDVDAEVERTEEI